ncbi:MAG: sulfatase [Saprospiraceae bacterium]|nr:sulfatase [Saprospiraceae bacterium]
MSKAGSALRYLLVSLIFGMFSIGCSEHHNEQNNSGITPDELSLPEQPNIVWLVVEDLSPYLPSFGDSTVRTPNLSRLAKEGICYDRFFASAPVCAPARASIATGMYPTHIAAGHMRTGGNPKYFPEGVTPYEAMPPAGVKMMSEWLRRQGYYCTNNSKEDYQFQKTVTAWDESSKQAHWRNRASEQPFFSIFNFTVTHESQIWAKSEDSLMVDPRLPVDVPPYLPDTEIGRNDVRRMYSNIVEMDRQVGEILDQLEEDGLLEETIIFWYSDHGGPLPRQKRLLYDSGLHVPMIIRFPNKQHAGTRNREMLSFIDLAPTALSLAGIAPKKYMDGIDFLGEYKPAESKKYIHAAADRFDAAYDKNRAVRDQRYKYIKYYEPEKPMFLHVKYRDQMPIMQELYRLRDAQKLTPAQALWFRDHKPTIEFFDTENDPHEINNVANDPAHAEKIEELSKECDRWLKAINDTGLREESALIESLWPNGKQPKVEEPDIKHTATEITLDCNTPGASIGYGWVSDKGQLPEIWQIYDGPMEINEGLTLVARADRIGYIPSNAVYLK